MKCRKSAYALLAAVLALPTLLGGCAAMKRLDPPAIEYVRADVLFEDLIRPHIRAWIDADGELTVQDRRALEVAFDAWQAAVKRAAAAHDIPTTIVIFEGNPDPLYVRGLDTDRLPEAYRCVDEDCVVLLVPRNAPGSHEAFR